MTRFNEARRFDEPGFQAGYAIVAVPARWTLERRDWKGAAALGPSFPSGHSSTAAAFFAALALLVGRRRDDRQKAVLVGIDTPTLVLSPNSEFFRFFDNAAGTLQPSPANPAAPAAAAPAAPAQPAN